MFLTTLKIQTYLKNYYVFNKQGCGTNCLWERPLMVVLKHSGKIKQFVLFYKKTNLYKITNSQFLFLSSVIVFLFSSLNNINLYVYIYIK